MTFQVSGRAYTALISGLAYRIYYTPASKTLMSIEPIGGAHYARPGAFAHMR